MRNWLRSLLSNGLLCPKCGGRRIEWRLTGWACPKCDLQ